MKYLVTGSGGSGTLSTMVALQKCGIDARHEYVFSVRCFTHGPLWDDWPHTVEVSGNAPLFLNQFKEKRPDCKIFHLVRDPIKVLASYWANRSRESGGTHDWEPMYLIAPHLEDLPFPDRGMARLVLVNELVEQYAEDRFRVEDERCRMIRAIDPKANIHIEAAVPKTLNTKRREFTGELAYREFTWDDLTVDTVREAGLQMAHRYGYLQKAD